MAQRGDTTGIESHLPKAQRLGTGRRAVLAAGFALAAFGALGTLTQPHPIMVLVDDKPATAKATLQMLRSALDTMRLDLGRYPTTAEGLALLLTPPERLFGL